MGSDEESAAGKWMVAGTSRWPGHHLHGVSAPHPHTSSQWRGGGHCLIESRSLYLAGLQMRDSTAATQV